MDSKDLTQVDWIPARRPEPVNLPIEVIAQRPTFLSALLLSAEVSGLEDKQIYGPLGIDAGQWSRIRSGKAHFPMNKFNEYCDIVGNDIVLLWLNCQRGYESKPLRSSLERQLEDARQALADRDRELEAIKTFVRETRS